MSVLVGTSGWQYDDWRDVFYPHAAPRPAWLAYYSAKFATVEVNNTFYRLPEAETFRRWAAETPDGFVVAVKVSRYLSHIKRLAEPEEPIARFVERADRARGRAWDRHCCSSRPASHATTTGSGASSSTGRRTCASRSSSATARGSTTTCSRCLQPTTSRSA